MTKILTKLPDEEAFALFNEPILLRIIGVIALVGGIILAISEWRWSGAFIALVGIVFFIRSFLIEQGYVNK